MSKPAHKLRAGALTVTVWKNDSASGPWYSATPSRSYKQGEEWRETDSFGVDDLLVVAKLLDHAHSWILEQPTDRPQVA